MAACAAAWAFFASAADIWAAEMLLFSSLCLDCIWLFWLSSSFFWLCRSAFWLTSSARSLSSAVLSASSPALAVFMLSMISVSFTEMSCMTSLKVSSSYRSFTALSMATLPPSRSSCMAAMCFLKSLHWSWISSSFSSISVSFSAISVSLALISCSFWPMLFCTEAICPLSTLIWS